MGSQDICRAEASILKKKPQSRLTKKDIDHIIKRWQAGEISGSQMCAELDELERKQITLSFSEQTCGHP